MAVDEGASDATPTQAIGDAGDEPNLYVVAKQVPIPSATGALSAAANTVLLVVAGIAAVGLGAGPVLIARRRRVHPRAEAG
ncbi:hypothetical protein [Dactylosporangium sp. CA-233914]|uniref:hypothetical protein n=1 Tax=Dactylosporangium sp. CA-233914 TaxID=3239934 RepID=UPI003D8C6B91